MGSFQLTETTSMTPSMMIYAVETHGAAITSFDLSKTCQAMAFGDSSGGVMMVMTYSDNDKVMEGDSDDDDDDDDITSFNLSRTCQAMAFGDSSGGVGG